MILCKERKKANFAEKKVKREEFIFTFLQTWNGELSLHVPFAPIMRLMAEASRKELECHTAVLKFKGADEVATILGTEWEITQLSPAQGNRLIRPDWIWVKELNFKSEKRNSIIFFY